MPNDVEPFTTAEVSEIIKACDAIGRTSYERRRAKAMVLALRYTALRIGDVAMQARTGSATLVIAGSFPCVRRRAANRSSSRSQGN